MKRLLLAISAIAALMGGTAVAQSFSPDRKLGTAERIIESFYVTDFDTTKVVDDAIRAMLKTLDPHSSYSTPEETRELTEPLQGNFSGIGIQFQMLNDTLYVIQTISGGPSERVGILAGDRILSAGDSVISGVKRKNTDIQRILRGPKGTTIDVTVNRRGTAKPLEFRITRDDIPIYSVDASYMVNPTTGYIRISRFAEETPAEVRSAIRKLSAHGMEDLIIDLQDNGGGYLQSACELAEMFLAPGDLIVYTDGDRVDPARYNARFNQLMPTGKVVVLVNQYSASASEILAGALQDNDRGVIVGRRTFGKGLVQRPFPFPDGSMIRLTVARYFTPAGRCIQKPYTSGDDEEYSHDLMNRYNSGELSSADSIHFADSLRCTTLRNHRTVYGGGGIMPDQFVPVDTTSWSPYYRDLLAKGIFNRFATNWIDTHRSQLKKTYATPEDFVARFEVTPAMMDDLVALGTADGVEFSQEGMDTSGRWIRHIVKAIIGRDLFEQSTYFMVVNPLDPVYNKGLEIISDPALYDALLQGQ